MNMKRLFILSFGMKCIIAVFFMGLLGMHYLVSKALFNRTASLDSVRIELDRGANANARSKSSFEKLKGLTPLMEAVSWNDLNRVKLLLKPQYKANVSLHALNEQGDTALIMAVRSPVFGKNEQQKKFEIIELLLQKGASLDAKNNFGDSPFIVVLDVSELDVRKKIAQILINAGADINTQNRNGDTNMHIAVQRGYSPWIVWFLTNYGNRLNLNLKNNDGYTIKELALRLKNETVMRAVNAGIASIKASKKKSQ